MSDDVVECPRCGSVGTPRRGVCYECGEPATTPTDRGDGTVVVIALVAALWTLGLPLAWMIHVWMSR